MNTDGNERGKGHPLPGSDEARHDRIPEHLERDKGRGDDAKAAVQPAGQAVAPDGEPYGDGELKSDRQAQQDRGPGIAAREQREG
jgi:hypothetical protein